MVTKRVILAGLMVAGVTTAANAGLDCTSDAIRKVALDLAGREVDPGIPLSNITDARTISRTRGGIVCEVVVKWADKEWERYRVNVGRSGTVR
jgi:hypothetical protein